MSLKNRLQELLQGETGVSMVIMPEALDQACARLEREGGTQLVAGMDHRIIILEKYGATFRLVKVPDHASGSPIED